MYPKWKWYDIETTIISYFSVYWILYWLMIFSLFEPENWMATLRLAGSRQETTAWEESINYHLFIYCAATLKQTIFLTVWKMQSVRVSVGHNKTSDYQLDFNVSIGFMFHQKHKRLSPAAQNHAVCFGKVLTYPTSLADGPLGLRFQRELSEDIKLHILMELQNCNYKAFAPPYPCIAK